MTCTDYHNIDGTRAPLNYYNKYFAIIKNKDWEYQAVHLVNHPSHIIQGCPDSNEPLPNEGKICSF
jgi:hypothetical protein